MGPPSVEVFLSEGAHQLELYVEDTEGLNTTDSVSIQVREANQAPSCDFVSPQDGEIFEFGELISSNLLSPIQIFPVINFWWNGLVIKMVSSLHSLAGADGLSNSVMLSFPSILM